MLGIAQHLQTGKMNIALISFIPTYGYDEQNKENPAIGFFSQAGRREYSGLVLIHSYRDMRLKQISEYVAGKKVFALSSTASNRQEFTRRAGTFLKNLRFFKRPARILTRSSGNGSIPPPPEEMATEEEEAEEEEAFDESDIKRVGWISYGEEDDSEGDVELTDVVVISVYGNADEEVAVYIIDLEEVVCTPDGDIREEEESLYDWDNYDEYHEEHKEEEGEEKGEGEKREAAGDDEYGEEKPWEPGPNRGAGGSSNNDNNNNSNNHRKTV